MTAASSMPAPVHGVPASLLALDEYLFNPDASQWLVIDSGNEALRGRAVPSLVDGLELVGKGRIAALVGHLRDGVGVVDIDKPGPLGDWLAAEVSDWLRRRDCWVLERPSGGANGRSHIFFAHPDFHYAPAATRAGFAAEVGTFLANLAADVKVPRSEVDLRDAVRPLTSPHRYGAVTKPKGDLRQSLRDLKRTLPQAPVATPLRPRAKVRPGKASSPNAAAAPTALVVPLVLQRWKRQLRADWRQYLLHGVIPAGSWASGATRSRTAVDIDRSLVEAACTREMVWAIGDPAMAWQLIRESHPTAMTKAKHQGYSWWLTYVWNELVRTAADFNTKPGAKTREVAAPPVEVVAAVAAGRRVLDELMWTVPARQRPALLLVGHQLLDRMLRAGDLRVPCPERDLLLDTGLGDRKTIRAALGRLNGRLGDLHTDCLSLTERDSTSYEFEINPAPEQGGRQIPPPVFDPPPAARGLWAILPRASHSLWRTLVQWEGPTDLGELAVKAGLVEVPTDVPSKSQRSTTKAALVALAKAGMARVDEEGRWRAASRPRSLEVEQAAAAGYADQLETVEAERAAYRAGITATWTAGRARAIKTARAREKGWWDNLSPAARAERTATKRLEFDQMSITQQAKHKAQLAERRIRAGLDEIRHHNAWIDSLSPDEYVQRSLERKQRFASLSQNERGLAVTAWSRHRTRFGLPPHSAQSAAVPATDQDLLPVGAVERDDVFLHRQVDQPMALPSTVRSAAG